MKILVTTNARLYKTKDGKYWTKTVYNYNFFKRYLAVFDNVKLISYCTNADYLDVENMIRVDGPNLDIFEIKSPIKKLYYITQIIKVRKKIIESIEDCDAALLRIPDHLSFQVYNVIKNKLPFAVEVTSNSWEFYSNLKKNKLTNLILKYYWHYKQKSACKNAIATSYVTEKALQNVYPPKRSKLDNGITTAITSASLDDSYFDNPKQYNDKKESFTLIHVSTSLSNMSKGYKELATAVGILYSKGYNIKLVLVGGGELPLNIKEIFDDYKYNDYVLTGTISNKDELIYELQKADIFVFPSYTEGLPRVIIEAMASGLPCIATDVGGISELISEECLISSKNVDEIVEKLSYLFDNPLTLNEISKRNFNAAKEYHENLINKKRYKFYSKFRNLVELGIIK